MPIDPDTKEALEQDISSNFSPNITLKYNGGTPIVFDSIVAHSRQLNLDEVLKADHNYIVVGVDYSSADQPFVRTCSDYMGEKRTPYLSGSISETEYAGFYGVTYPTAISLPITLNERRIQKMGLYVSNPTGNTSRLRVQILNEKGKSIWAKIFYSAEVGSEALHWFEFPVGVTAPSLEITLVLDEFAEGASPLGFKVGRDILMNPLCRFYACTVGRYVGKVNISTVRIQVVGKPKQKGREPSPSIYVGVDDILLQTAKQLREHIWANWTKYALNDVRPIIYVQDGASIYYWQSLFFEVALITKDIGGEPEQKYTLEQLDIQVSQR